MRLRLTFSKELDVGWDRATVLAQTVLLGHLRDQCRVGHARAGTGDGAGRAAVPVGQPEDVNQANVKRREPGITPSDFKRRSAPEGKKERKKERKKRKKERTKERKNDQQEELSRVCQTACQTARGGKGVRNGRPKWPNSFVDAAVLPELSTGDGGNGFTRYAGQA